jgi:nucleoside-diphosphate-sugar epimerase
MIAVVAGATGLSGQALIRELEQDSRFTEVHAWVRVSGKLPKLSKLREHVLPPGGFEELLKKPMDSFQGLTTQGAAFFCALGTTIKKAGSREAFRRVDFHEVVSFGKFSEKAHGQSFALVSAVGAATDSLVFYSRVKAEAEDAVQALAIPRVAIFRPSFLIGDRQESRPMERFFIPANGGRRHRPKIHAASIPFPIHPTACRQSFELSLNLVDASSHAICDPANPAAVKAINCSITFSTGSLRCLSLSIWLTRPLSERIYIIAPYMHSRRH